MVAFWNTLYTALAGADYLALLALVFAAAALTVGAAGLLVLGRDPLRARLARLVPARAAGRLRSPIVEAEADGFVTRVVAPLHKMASPGDVAEQRKIRQMLVHAGFRSRSAYRVYLGFKVLLGLLFPLAYLFASVFYKFSPQVLAIAVLLGGLGFMLPTWALRWRVQAHQRRINRALPDALDLMVVCAEAGLGLDMILKRVGEEMRPISRDLSDEFYLTNLEAQAGKPRAEALKNMAARTGVQEVANLMTILVQATRFGTSIASALRVHAEAMRVRRRQAAEEQAGKLMVKILFPLVLFIFPALFVVLVGPAGIRIAKNLLPALGGG